MASVFCVLYIVFWLLIVGTWIQQYGFRKGMAAGLLRAGWTMPFLTLWFPHVRMEALPVAGKSTILHVLLDDSDSMKIHKKEVTIWQDRLTSSCEKIGCKWVLHQLSHLEPDVKFGISPLYRGWTKWKKNITDQPWIFLSDGGDSFFQVPTAHADGENGTTGLAIGVGSTPKNAIWIDAWEPPSLSFDSQGVPISFQLTRSEAAEKAETLQVQILESGKILQTQNIQFPQGAQEQRFGFDLPAFTKGTHLLTFRVLPQKDQQFLWGNERTFSVETMPNTVGVLHLLGAPSWDGRFLRRYFKAEPKFDLVNFFILRDPWDEQEVQERNISLVQFPVEKLFTKELHNFRLIVMQNFSLSQFLEPQYQENLVRFVQDGGSLLFIGGPRALTQADLAHSPLRKIFPFSIEDAPSPYEPQSFRLRLAAPTVEQRALASVYEEWAPQAPFFSRIDTLVGLHRGKQSSLQSASVTPLLEAEFPSGERVPLAVASYPGKGRALWVFSDSLWRLALAKSQGIPRSLYQDMWDKSMQWLLRQELQQPLSFQTIEIEKRPEGHLHVYAELYGPAVRYWDDKRWTFSLCGETYPLDQLSFHRYSAGDLSLEGDFPVTGALLASGCKIRLRGENERFGSLVIEKMVPILTPRPDRDLPDNPEFMRKISQQSHGIFIPSTQEGAAIFDKWMLDHGSDRSVLPSVQSRSLQEVYWFFHSPWIWLVLLFSFGEIIVRRYVFS